MPKETVFAVYASSIGNYFFAEFRELFLPALRELGMKVLAGDEKTGFLPGADWHIVIAPHEFFHMGRGITLRHARPPGGVILFITDPPDSKWFSLARKSFPRARAVWAIDEETADCVAGMGFRARHVPAGYAGKSRLFRRVERLPAHYGTLFLEPRVRGPAGALGLLARRPLDAVFQGGLTARRDRFFAKLAPRLGTLRTYFHFTDTTKPVVPGENSTMDTRTVIGLAQRAKVVLNVHRRQARYFEWQRVVMQGIGQGALVISEPCTATRPFVPGRDFVEASLAEIPDALEHYLGSARGLREAQVIADRGRRTLTEDCRLADRLVPALDELADLSGGRANGGPRAPRAAVVVSSAMEPVPASVTARGGGGGPAPKAAVGITLRNYREFILPCLESVRAQSARRLDLVVVDDASDDGSGEAVRRWLARHGRRFARFELVRTRRRSGLARARNTCFARARTSRVFVLDADNLMLPVCLERLGSALDNCRADFAYSYLSRFGEQDSVMNRKPWRPDFFNTGNYLDAMALVRKKTWKALGGYRDHGVQGWEDFDFWIRLARRGGWGILVPEILGSYRVHLRSMLHAETNPQAWKLEAYFRETFGVDFRTEQLSDVEVAFSLFGSNRLPPAVRRGAMKKSGREREKYVYQAAMILDRLNADLKDVRS